MVTTLRQRMERVARIQSWFAEDPILETFVTGNGQGQVPVTDDNSIELERKVDETKIVAPASPTAELPALHALSVKQYTRPNCGISARFLRYLYTGAAYPEDVRRTLNIDRHNFAKTVSNLRIKKFIEVRTTDGKLGLTDIGRVPAKYFVDNPSALNLPKTFGR